MQRRGSLVESTRRTTKRVNKQAEKVVPAAIRAKVGYVVWTTNHNPSLRTSLRQGKSERVHTPLWTSGVHNPVVVSVTGLLAPIVH